MNRPSLFTKVMYRIAQKKGYHNKKEYHKLLKINQIPQNELDSQEIVVYFFGTMGQVYQIKQWIDTFSELHKQHKITVVVRNFNVYRFWRKVLPFHIYYCYTINDMLSFYETTHPKVIIYINNGFKNFQSLIYEDALHIHINHGESDKSSDHSNQVKGYDYIFVHGPNGYDNYMKYLIKLDPNQLVQTGRPQLDFIKPIKLDTFGRKVVIYAPTWEATHRSMRYTSVDIYGEQIVDALLSDERYYFIYKPHPNLGANDKKVLAIHQAMLEKIKNDPYAITITDTDVNNIYPIVDFAIFDMSSIMTDYLNVDKPFILADVFDPLVHKVDDYNVLKGCNRLTLENVENLLDVVTDEIDNDPMKAHREEIKRVYLGDYKQGESIKKFIDSVSNIIAQRDREVAQKDSEVVS
ncbi:MAG TPA: hypothetical protein EYG90_02150 [Campylobacterales bacterium]|nr:hypothetical protein [Campylobacterales bacterium]